MDTQLVAKSQKIEIYFHGNGIIIFFGIGLKKLSGNMYFLKMNTTFESLCENEILFSRIRIHFLEMDTDFGHFGSKLKK